MGNKIKEVWFDQNIQHLETRFIVSTGRTGTKFFETFINQQEGNAHCFHEPKPDLFTLGVQKMRSNLSTGAIVKEIKSNRFRYLTQLRKKKLDIYIESNPFLSLLLPELRIAFPGCKILIIVRDPLDYINSILNKRIGPNKDLYPYGNKDRRERLAATDFPDDPYCDDWETFSRAEKVAWYWNKCNSILYQESFGYQNAMVVRFEDVFNTSDLKGLNDIVDFLGMKLSRLNQGGQIDFYSQKVNTNKDRLYSFSQLSEPIKENIVEIITESSTLLDYTIPTIHS